MSHDSVPVKRSKTKDSEMSETLTCPVCLELFNKPVMLPECGHTFCFACAEKLVKPARYGKFSITCPECRCESWLGTVGSAALKPNITVGKFLDLHRANNNVPKEAPFTEICSHEVGDTPKTKCGHCLASFCKPCLLSHMERLRIEINWMSHNFQPRFDDYYDALGDKVGEAVNLVRTKAESLCDLVNYYADQLFVTFQSAVRRYKEDLLTLINDLTNRNVAQLDDARNNPVRKEEMLDVVRKIRGMNENSLLFCPIEEMAEIHKQACEIDRQISFLEDGLPSNDLSLSFVCPTIDELIKTFVPRFQVHAVVQPKSSNQDMPKEIRNFHELVTKGDFGKVKEIFSRKSLLRGCKNFMISHCDDSKHIPLPLCQAAESGSLELVKFFVEDYGADVMCVGKKGDMPAIPPIFWAARNGHLPIVKYLWEREDNQPYFVDSNKTSILHYAVQSNSVDVVRFLVERDPALLQLVDGQENTSWSSAAMSANPKVMEIVMLLLENGACVRLHGYNILHVAACGNLEVFRYLHKRYPDMANGLCPNNSTPLHYAANWGRSDIVKYILENCKPNVDQVNAFGDTPLFLAVIGGHPDVVEILLDNGADIGFVKKETRETPLHLAVKTNCVDVTDRLIDRKACDFRRDDYGARLLIFALNRRSYDVAKLLVAKGAIG